MIPFSQKESAAGSRQLTRPVFLLYVGPSPSPSLCRRDPLSTSYRDRALRPRCRMIAGQAGRRSITLDEVRVGAVAGETERLRVNVGEVTRRLHRRGKSLLNRSSRQSGVYPAKLLPLLPGKEKQLAFPLDIRDAASSRRMPSTPSTGPTGTIQP